MKPNTKTKFSDRFSAKVEDIRKKTAMPTEPEPEPEAPVEQDVTDTITAEIKDRIQRNLDNRQNDQILSFTDIELLQLISRTKNVKTLDEATLLQIELQSMMLLTLKAIDWKLWEMYNKAGKNN